MRSMMSEMLLVCVLLFAVFLAGLLVRHNCREVEHTVRHFTVAVSSSWPYLSGGIDQSCRFPFQWRLHHMGVSAVGRTYPVLRCLFSLLFHKIHRCIVVILYCKRLRRRLRVCALSSYIYAFFFFFFVALSSKSCLMPSDMPTSFYLTKDVTNAICFAMLDVLSPSPNDTKMQI